MIMNRITLFLLGSAFASLTAYAEPELQSYQCEISAVDESGRPLVSSPPSPIKVNKHTVRHILYVTFQGVETFRIGLSPYEGQLHIIGEKKNSNGRFRLFAGTMTPLGTPRISQDLIGVEGNSAYTTCVLEKSQ